MLLLTLINNYVRFNDKSFKQKQGLPMGSCLSPLIADLYLGDYFKKYLYQLNLTKKIWRYVDDVIIITTMNKMQLTEYVENINKIRSKIRFTLEYEDDNKTINFLDTTLTRNIQDKKINIRWFRKKIASNTLLDYNSCHHKSVKRNIVMDMASRITNNNQHSRTEGKYRKTNRHIEEIKLSIQRNEPFN